ncbi:hypothetical protein QYF61_006265 [Mycteria americana]|uniref:ribonuclease H n=1 Tax=Mycteria americana TaxID=33587 RepID=A0AAN7NKS1_MYCAM|nr:hypothetical protein QYF61_006265 [Mycteria americana]
MRAVVPTGIGGSDKPAKTPTDGLPAGSLHLLEMDRIEPMILEGTTFGKRLTAIQAVTHPWMATLDVKDMFFMIPLRKEDKPQFAFIWEETQYTFNQLPQGYKHSPTIAHNALAKLLDAVEVLSGICMYQYTDDILVGGDNKDQVGQVAKAIWNLLTKNGLDILPSKCQGPGQGVKFLGA